MISKILFISDSKAPDYMCDMVFHGLKSKFGNNVHHTSSMWYMFNNISAEQKQRLYGKGFTLYGLLSPNTQHVVNDEEVNRLIHEKYYDLIIYGSIRRCSSYLSLVKKNYLRTSVFFVDGEDDQKIEQELTIHGIYFKRELTSPTYGVFPINFGIPSEKIVSSVPPKKKLMAQIIPGDISTYIYDTELDYYTDYQSSWFGTTTKKAGWDCLRHYEILANGCIPYFPDLTQCPTSTLTSFPKHIIQRTNEEYSEGNHDEEQTNKLVEELLAWTRTYLTTESIVQKLINIAKYMKNDEYYSSSRQELFQYLPVNLQKTLDIGCGEGSFSLLLKNQRHVECWGVEPTKAGELAKGRLDEVLIGTLQEVHDQIPKKYFDCVFFNDVLEHMLDPEEALQKVKSNLNETGIVMASIPNFRYILNLKEIFIEKDWRYKDSGILDKTHFRFFTKKSIVRLFEKNGYDIVSIHGINSLNTFKLKLLNILTFNKLEDTKHLQFLVLAKPRT